MFKFNNVNKHKEKIEANTKSIKIWTINIFFVLNYKTTYITKNN